MKLHPVQGKSLVTDPHDFSFLGPSGNFKIRVVKGLSSDDKRVIPGGVERMRHADKKPAAIVMDGGNFAVHDPGVSDDFPAEIVANTLMPKAHPKNGNLLIKGHDHFV